MREDKGPFQREGLAESLRVRRRAITYSFHVTGKERLPTFKVTVIQGERREGEITRRPGFMEKSGKA